MAKKFLHFLKIFGITFGIFFGAIAVYLGIVWLITGFKPEIIELNALKFSQEEYFFSDKDENGEDVENVTIMVLSDPENTTQLEVKLDFFKGKGHDVVELPIADGAQECIVKVNEPIPLKLKRDAVTNEVIGGEIQLRAIGKENEFASAECFIYIDTPVSSFNLNVTRGEGEDKATIVTEPKELASQIFPGYELDIAVDNNSVLPKGSRQPFNEIYNRQLSEGKSEEELIRNDYKRVYWESSDPTRATVDGEGKITILSTAAPGDVTITARIYKTYELQDSHKTLFDFEYDVNIDPENAVEEYQKYLEKITAVKSVTLTIKDMDVDNISTSKPTSASASGFRYNVGVNQTTTFYLDGNMENSLGLSINPSENVTEQFTSEDLRYKLSRIFIIPSYAQGGITNFQNGNDCLIVSSIAGSLDSGFYFTVTATYPQDFIEKGTCLIIGLGVWDEETQSLKRNPDGSYVLDTDVDGNSINYLQIHIEITQKLPDLIAIAANEQYTDITQIPDRQEFELNMNGTVELDAYVYYTNNENKKVTKSGKAGIITEDLTYSMVAFFVPEGTECIDYDDTYGIYLGGMWYPIGISPIIDSYNKEVLTANSILSNFKATGEIQVIAVLLRTDRDGRVLLVDENHARPVDENGKILDPSSYAEYTEQLYYDYIMKSGTQDVESGIGQVNYFTVTVSEKFNPSKLTISQKCSEQGYEDYVVLSAENDNLNQFYTQKNVDKDYVWLLVHYEEEGTSSEEGGVLQSAFKLNNFKIESGDAFNLVKAGLTNDGVEFTKDESGKDILFQMEKMGTTEKPITVKFVLNGEIIFSFNVSISDKRIEKLYLETNALKEQSEELNCEKITVIVNPSDQNSNSNWNVQAYDKLTSSTVYLPLEISTKFTYQGAGEIFEDLNENFDIMLNYTISKEIDGEYSSMVKNNGKLIASINNGDRYYLTSKSQPDNDYYGTINFFSSGIIYLKATIAPYGNDIKSQTIYEIHIVVDEDNWEFNKDYSKDREYLMVDMPLINNTSLTDNQARYKMLDLSQLAGGMTGTYAQLYDTDPTNVINDVSTLLIDLSQFVSVSYKGNVLTVSKTTEHTKFLNFEIISYNILSPSSNTYDIIKDSTYNKAEIFFNEETETFFLRIKAVNYNTRINLKVTTYFGISDTYTILVNSPVYAEKTINELQLNQEYVALGISFDLLTRVNLLTKNYIYSNTWKGVTDLGDTTFKALINTYLLNTGAANETNNTDTQTYIETSEKSTQITVVKDSSTTLSFKLNMVFDFDASTDNGSQNSQETEWATYYYVKLVTSSKFERNCDNPYDFNGVTYQNLFVGQNYYFDKLKYIEWLCLELDGTDKVVLDEKGKPKYSNNTDDINIKFKTTAFSVTSDGHEIFDNGVKLASIHQNEKGNYNILVIEPNIFENMVNPNSILLVLEVDNNENVTSEYYVRINPLIISVTKEDAIETFIGTNYNLNDSVQIKSPQTNNDLTGLNVEYEIVEISEIIENKPTIEMNKEDLNGDGKIDEDEKSTFVITPHTDSGLASYPSRNFNFEVIVRVGTLEKTINFICGRINATFSSSHTYIYSDIIKDSNEDVEYASMLEGSELEVESIVQLTSSIVDDPNEVTKIEEFNSFKILSNNYALVNSGNSVLPNSNLELLPSKDQQSYYIYYGEQLLLSLDTNTGKIETTTFLPDNYKLYLYVTCVYNSSYSYDLPIKVNSIVFNSTLDSATDINLVKDGSGTTIYLLSGANEVTDIGKLKGDYITAKSNNFINADANNQAPYNQNGDLALNLKFKTNTENISISLDGRVFCGDKVICEITPLGAITVKEKLTMTYAFNLEVMYEFSNKESSYSICSYKIVIVPEYSLVQRDETISYSKTDPYRVNLKDSLSLNLINDSNSILYLKKVNYEGTKIFFNQNQVSYTIVNPSSVNSTILFVEFDYSLVNENDPNKTIMAKECYITNGVLNLPRSIASEVLIKVTASITITNSQTSIYDYYIMIEPGVKLQLNLDPTKSETIEDVRYYKVTTTGVEEHDNSLLSLDFADVFTLTGDTANIYGYEISIEKAQLLDIMGNTLIDDGIIVNNSTISLLSGETLVANIDLIDLGYTKKLVTTYSMQKEVCITFKIVVNYRGNGKVEFSLNLRLMPIVTITSESANTEVMMISGKPFKFNNHITLQELNSTTFDYGNMSEELKSKFTQNIKFKVEGSINNFNYSDSYQTDVTISEVQQKTVDILLVSNINETILFTYTLKIYPLYRFEMEITNPSDNSTQKINEIELIEGQTSTIPAKYINIKSVKFNPDGTPLTTDNGQPVYVKDLIQTDRIVIEIPVEYQEFAQRMDEKSIYIKTYTDSIIYATAKLEISSRFMTYNIPIRILDIEVTIQKFENKEVTSTSPIILPAGTNNQVLMLDKNTDSSTLYFYKLHCLKTDGKYEELFYNNSSEYHRVVITNVTSTSGKYVQKLGTENVVEYSLDTSIIISFANNRLTVSGKVNEQVDVTLKIYVGDVPDSKTLYFTFYPVQMESKVTQSYINNNGDNLQILAINGGAEISMNQYLGVSSKYVVDGKTYVPNYDFTNRIKFIFPTSKEEDPDVDAVTGIFANHAISGKQDILTLTDIEDRTITIKLVTNADGSTSLVIDKKIWDTKIQELELVVKAQIGLLKTYLRFYISPIAFKYNYAYKASSGQSYYYHSTYVDYAYNESNPLNVSKELVLSDLILGATQNVQLEFNQANVSNAKLLVKNQSASNIADAQMGTIPSVIGYVYDADGINYAFLKYVGGKYYLSFNVKTKEVTINQSKFQVPVISETLDLYLTLTYGEIERLIHIEILPYIQMQTSMNDTYERVDDNGSKNDPTDDTVVLYDYYLSGNSYTLDYFYNYTLDSCYNYNNTVMDIRNTVLKRVSKTSGLTYQITSYEKCKLIPKEQDGVYFEDLPETSTSLPNQKLITFKDSTLTIDPDLDYVVYLKILGRAENGYESYFYAKIIPNILFKALEDSGYVNPTISGERFEFEKIEDENEEFLANSKQINATITNIDYSGKTAEATYTIFVETDAGTVEKLYTSKLDIYSDQMYIGAKITINYKPSNPEKIIMSAFSECSADVTQISGNQVFVNYSLVDGEDTYEYSSSFVYKDVSKLSVGAKVLIKYSRDIPTIIKYSGYLSKTASFDADNKVETILTGSDYDLKQCLSAYTPSIVNNRIEEYFDETTSAYYTRYADKNLEYKTMYAWYYGPLKDEVTQKPIALMADISEKGNVVIDGEEVVIIDSNIIHASSSLTYDIYINIQGTYEYNTTRIYKKDFYLRIVPAMKFFIIDSATEMPKEVGKGENVLTIESISDTYIDKMDDGTRKLDLDKYIKGKKIVSDKGIIQIEGNVVQYNDLLTLTYEIQEVKIYTILSDNASTAEGEVASNILLAQNGLIFNNGVFILEKTYNATCDILFTISTVIDSTVFSFDILIQLYRESLISVDYMDAYIQDESIIYETIVSGTSRNSINFNTGGYLTPYVWSTKDSKYIETSITKTVTITSHDICKQDSPAGGDRTTIQNNIVTFNDANGRVTANDEILGDYYFTIQVNLNYNGKDNKYTFYFRVLGKYVFETATLQNYYVDNEQLLYNQLIEPEVPASGSSVLYATAKIMTKKPTMSDGLILIATRKVNGDEITKSYELSYLNGLTLQSSKVESVYNDKKESIYYNPETPTLNPFAYSYKNPSTSSTGSISLNFNDSYYTTQTKKSLYITLNFTFTYTNNIFSDIYSIQYVIMLVPNQE